MAENKKSFMLYCDQRTYFDDLTDEEAGRLIKHVFAYVNDEDPEFNDRLMDMAFKPIKIQLKRDLAKWEIEIKQRREAGRKGGQARVRNVKRTQAPLSTAKRTQAPLSTAKRTQANQADNVNVNVNVKDNVNVNDKEKKEKKGLKPTRSLKVSKDDFKDWLSEKKIDTEQKKIVADIGWAKLEAWKENGWRDFKGNKILSWRGKCSGSLRHWVREAKEVKTNGIERDKRITTSITSAWDERSKKELGI